MRIALVLLALAFAGCAKKQAPAQAPAPPAATPADEAAPGGTSSGTSEDPETDTMQGDPCDGGESKGK